MNLRTTLFGYLSLLAMLGGMQPTFNASKLNASKLHASKRTEKKSRHEKHHKHSSSSSSSSSSNHHHKKQKCDPIVGTFVWNEILTGDVADGPDYGQWVFNADGTVHVDGTDNFQRPYPHLYGTPNGADGAPYFGIWKKVGRKTYEVAAVSVISLVNFCETDSESCPTQVINPNNIFLPGPGTGFRIRAQGIVTLSDDGSTASGNLVFNYYTFTDATFSTPLPIGPLPSLLNFTRVVF